MSVPMLSSTAEVAPPVELFTPAEELALSGFRAGYSGLTREAYTLDLRQYVAWCTRSRCSPPAGPTSKASAGTSSR
jgi:hypothetical protein